MTITDEKLREAVEYTKRPMMGENFYAGKIELAYETIEAALAELETLRAANTWQPIEIAPKDGTWFIAHDLKHGWRCVPHICVVRYADGVNVDANGTVRSNLTHWMPLPTPPKED